MAITIDISKHQSNLRQQAWVIIGVSFLYGLAMAAVLFIPAAFVLTLDRWPGYIGLSLGIFALFTGGAFMTYSTFYANRAWGKYTIDETGVTLVKHERTFTFPWEKFASYSTAPLVYAKVTRDPGSNEKLYPKIVRRQVYAHMQMLFLYPKEGVLKFTPALEVPLGEKEFPQVVAWARVRLVENQGVSAKMQRGFAGWDADDVQDQNSLKK